MLQIYSHPIFLEQTGGPLLDILPHFHKYVSNRHVQAKSCPPSVKPEYICQGISLDPVMNFFWWWLRGQGARFDTGRPGVQSQQNVCLGPICVGDTQFEGS